MDEQKTKASKTFDEKRCHNCKHNSVPRGYKPHGWRSEWKVNFVAKQTIDPVEKFVVEVYSKSRRRKYITKKSKIYHIVDTWSMDLLDLTDSGTEKIDCMDVFGCDW